MLSLLNKHTLTEFKLIFKALIPKFIWKGKDIRIAKTMLKKVEGITVPDYKTCYAIIIIRTVWHW